jgi:PTH1 family peptidyl-tRNA hydrolase
VAQLLFGLGNPGREYAATRHNAGFQVLDLLAERFGGSFRASRFLQAEDADVAVEGRRVRLVKPLSYMNLCGPVYARALDVFGATPGEALVVVDDFALPLGRLRLRADGSAGGHNGLRSIEETLGSRAYPRLRVGIGPCPAPVDPAVWVLQRPTAEERRALPELLRRAADAALAWSASGMEAAMRRYNPDPAPPAAPPPDGGRDHPDRG